MSFQFNCVKKKCTFYQRIHDNYDLGTLQRPFRSMDGATKLHTREALSHAIQSDENSTKNKSNYFLLNIHVAPLLLRNGHISKEWLFKIM